MTARGAGVARVRLSAARRALARAATVVRQILGAPDYATYAAHVRAAHPEREPMTRDEFARDALARRYDRPGSRCC